MTIANEPLPNAAPSRRSYQAARLVALGLAALSAHCGAKDPPPGPAGPKAEAPVSAEAGFVDVPPRDVSLKGQTVHVEAAARIFYNLQPADESPGDKPIFILFNGFAAEIVRAFGTGPRTVAEGGDVVANPSPLTRLANLVYIDPRQAGFSYDVPPSRAPSPSDCASDIFNEYVDAADVLLATLQFLQEHPSLHGPVYWVGESYAGVRVQWILAYLRGRFDLASYKDAVLQGKIADAGRPASLRAGQILLEPWLAGGAHTDAIAMACEDPAALADVSASLGAPCAGTSACACADSHARSRYNYTYTLGRQQTREIEASLAHVVPERAAALFGVPLTSIPRLRAGERALGFKCSPPDSDTPPEDALALALGPLPGGQFYYVPYSPLQPGKETAPTNPDWRSQNFVGAAFIDNLRDVPTFVTEGPRDLVVPPRALVPALRALVGADRVDDTSASHLRVSYPEGDRFIDLGLYPSAGHMITMIEPEPFARDVAAWLSQR